VTKKISVTIPKAAKMLGIGTTKLNSLIKDGHLETFHEGASHLVWVKSIKQRVRKLRDLEKTRRDDGNGDNSEK